MFLLFVLFVSFVFTDAAQEPAQNRREFTIVAKDHTFTPNKLDVSQDDLVKITLRSEDVPASFAIDAYRIIKRVPGRSSSRCWQAASADRAIRGSSVVSLVMAGSGAARAERCGLSRPSRAA